MTTQQLGTLTFFCGKMGAGKSTRSLALAAQTNAVLISEDEWLAVHYPDEIHGFEDYLTYSARIRPFIKGHVQSLLSAGVDVVMDFPANTVKQRSWFRQLCEEIGCPHTMEYLAVSDETCLSRLAKRSVEQPQRARFDNEEVFRQVTRYFEEPTDDEGLNVEVFEEGSSSGPV